MSIITKVSEESSKSLFTQKIEKTLFDILDDDEPVNVYMLTDICKSTGVVFEHHFPKEYVSGQYNLTKISNGNFDTVLKLTEALYNTCIRFQKFDLALIVNSVVMRGLLDTGLNLNWVDGRFYNC
ncbi:hypothetical protein [Mucilaginibacter sp. KACC 22063]|uniref:hypothetical protein n=1 Tax=Mucilaginibacter sp. KACC 22063 TaxID=3025666 RepID=UPI0023653670|nr:hypothetical protein [Mucilaginibacter sp. KACC 22063]WDF55003.1 hypothetical protein PQ461_18910 [Mucilaginibacter sp. KACC 22063]